MPSRPHTPEEYDEWFARMGIELEDTTRRADLAAWLNEMELQSNYSGKFIPTEARLDALQEAAARTITQYPEIDVKATLTTTYRDVLTGKFISKAIYDAFPELSYATRIMSYRDLITGQMLPFEGVAQKLAGLFPL